MKKLGKVLFTLLLVLVVLFTVLVAPRVIGQADLSPMEGYHYAHRGYHDGNVAVAENSNTTLKILKSLSEDEYWSVRLAVAKHPNTSKDILIELLVFDGDNDVCEAAKERLREIMS